MSLTAWGTRTPTSAPGVSVRIESLDGVNLPPSERGLVVMARQPDYFVIPDGPEVRAMGIQPGARRVACRIEAPCPLCGARAKLDVCEGSDRAACYECGACRQFAIVQLPDPLPAEVVGAIARASRGPL